uniref:Angiotensin-converting enzyme n=1 Tax=Haematobia irritans exigua TaxID=34678 RepID=ACE_HAEIX|nr:RecName: Full=Angiotensin-converting enzyme; AltName: Full=Dipeptidyl carboxypeptidase I; AltName: Full=Kininase II; Flags: Precursor [Haematobia irritans exigua]AAA70427.1 angiotensin converting enzyme [Haematobia irritans exigua]prf//2210282A angiotensin-converting enzyme [Haematobia irritans exigua]
MKLLVVTILAGLAVCHGATKEEIVATEYLQNINKELAKHTNVETEVSWAYASNITDENERLRNEISAENAKFLKEVAKDIQKFNWRTYGSADVRRQFKSLSKTGYSALPAEDYAELLEVLSAMESNFAKVRVCDYKNSAKCDLSLDPEIEEIITKSRDPEELKYYWTQFYDKAGTPTRSNFEKYVELNTKSAKLNNFTDGAEVWLDEYEDATFEDQLEAIFEDIKPLYDQVHGYVRYRLNKFYGDEVVSKTGPLPMHLLGNMWAQQWSSIADIVSPFPEKPLVDVSDEMVAQGYTPLKMFQMGDDFFQSMGLKKLPQEFWDKSILEKPDDGRDLVCHASAWDFYLTDDVRIKQCTRVTQDQFFTVHHEMGHIQYFLQYQHQPFVYRTGANPGFHEAVGDVLSLSVSTPKHLERVGLLKNYVSDNEARINQLFLTALDKIVFLPFAFTMDKYRWALFRGQADKSEWNCAFWKLREEYSGIEPPVVRTEKDFDAPAKYHVSADVEYLRYLVSFIIQFQFYKSACITAGEYVPNQTEYPLDNCDIYGSKEAGKLFENMLSLGASKPWPDALEAFNGERTMTGKAIAEYFEPLRVWLEAVAVESLCHQRYKNVDL